MLDLGAKVDKVIKLLEQIVELLQKIDRKMHSKSFWCRNIYGEESENVEPDSNIAFSYSCPDTACATLLYDRLSEFYIDFLSALEKQAFDNGVASVKNNKVKVKGK